ncbi:MAG: MlaD family protein [Planctomycetota bacterium]|nr:MlaD family protein [Planctomycetota bacterium]
MEESGYRFGVGVLVMASAIIGVLLIAFFGAVPTLWVDRNRVSFNFPTAPRVAVDTPVRKNGVLIGRVSSIALQPGDKGVIVRMELDRKVELRKGEVPKILSGSIITGDAVIEFIAGTPESNLRRFDGTQGTPPDGILDASEAAPINEIITDAFYSTGGEVAPDPFESLVRVEQSLLPLMSTVNITLQRFDKIGASMQEVIGDGDGPIRDMVTSIKETSEVVKTTVNDIGKVAKQVERAQIPDAIANALAEVPGIFKEAQSTLAQTQRTLKGFEQFSASLEGLGKEFEGIGETIRKAVDNANTAIENIAEITEPVSQNSEVLVANAVNALENLNALSVDLKRFTTRLNNSRGTVAELVDNPQIAYKVNQTLQNIQTASANVEILTQRLQPIIGDVRVFSDKIARNPGALIDLKGTISGRPRGVGLK